MKNSAFFSSFVTSKSGGRIKASHSHTHTRKQLWKPIIQKNKKGMGVCVGGTDIQRTCELCFYQKMVVKGTAASSLFIYLFVDKPPCSRALRVALVVHMACVMGVLGGWWIAQ